MSKGHAKGLARGAGQCGADRTLTSEWHAESPDAVLERLDAHPTGLSPEQIGARQAEYGPNRLPEAPRPSPWRRLLRQFHNILIYVLLASAMVTALLAHWLDTVVILAVVIANAVIGFIQEGKAEEAMASLRRLLALKAAVIRDDQRQTVAGAELVPGDVVLLESGDRVPADLRLLEVHDLHVQEAILTGESEAVKSRSTRSVPRPRSETVAPWPSAARSSRGAVPRGW